MDKVNAIHQEIYDSLCSETYSGGLFDGFRVYREKDMDKSLFFPCLVVTRDPLGPVTEFCGSGGLSATEIKIELGYKEKEGFEYIEHTTYDTDALMNLYAERMESFYNEITFSSDINRASMNKRMDYFYPMEKNHELYGLAMTITVEYER